jgi:glycosyltransferase involved in cell wall biosynthesis
MTVLSAPIQYPYVSVCTPTFNRRPFIASMLQCFDHQTYPKDRMEWIIIDDGTDKIDDLVKQHPNVKYFACDEKMPLGKKRNMMHDKSCGEIIVYMDDDDYYPPDRVSHAVEALLANPTILCAGSSEIYIYFKHIDKMFQFGPYGPNHATAGTFAFRRELLTHTRYSDTACLAEERAFLKDYSIPMVQLDPRKVILVFSHEHNTFDKRKLLENANPVYVRETVKNMDDFITGPTAKNLKQFFMNELCSLLKYYEPGHPNMKPDVISQTTELEQSRHQMMLRQQQDQEINAGGAIIMHQEGKEPITLTNDQVVGIIQAQQAQIKDLTAKAAEHQAEKSKLESSILYMNLHNTAADSSTGPLLTACLSDLSERDETIKKLKSLYMKTIIENGELKTQITQMRTAMHEMQTREFNYKRDDNNAKEKQQERQQDQQDELDVLIPKKIVDCFTFYNELDLLKYRLSILNDCVDYFILVEATHTHVGKEKPLVYQENKELFKEFNHKIIHIVVDDFLYKYPNINIENREQWNNEIFQRNCIKRGLDKLKLNDEDVFTVTDLDEIPDPKILEKIKKNEINIDVVTIELDFYYYNLNSKINCSWHLSKMISYKKYKELGFSCEQIRQMQLCEIIPTAGWHLSYFGDEKFIKNKIENFAHQEYNIEKVKNENNILNSIKNNKSIYNGSPIVNVEIKDNENLPPKYDKYLTKYYK